MSCHITSTARMMAMRNSVTGVIHDRAARGRVSRPTSAISEGASVSACHVSKSSVYLGNPGPGQYPKMVPHGTDCGYAESTKADTRLLYRSGQNTAG